MRTPCLILLIATLAGCSKPEPSAGASSSPPTAFPPPSVATSAAVASAIAVGPRALAICQKMLIAVGGERCKPPSGDLDNAGIVIVDKAGIAGVISCEKDRRSYNFMETQWEAAGNTVVGSPKTLCHGQFWQHDSKTPPPPGILAKIAAFFGEL